MNDKKKIKIILFTCSPFFFLLNWVLGFRAALFCYVILCAAVFVSLMEHETNETKRPK